MKHILVTGGAGFIGSHLCDALLDRGYAVSALDNLSTGRLSNLKNAFKSSFFSFSNQDVCSLKTNTLPFLNQYGLHSICHFACPASPVDFQKLAIEILQVDSLGTIQLVNLALAYQARFLLASTSEIYGDPLIHPQHEGYWGNVNTWGPRSCYDETKRFAEAYVYTCIQEKNLNAGVARIFNSYGPRMRSNDGRIIPQWMYQAQQGEALTVHGTGKQTRSFCYIDDLILGILALLESSLHQPINLGNPQESSLLELHAIFSKLFQRNLPLHHLPERPDDPKRRCPDITQAREKLSWSPSISLEQGLTLTFKSNDAT